MSTEFSKLANDLVARHLRSLYRHRERYLRAWCAAYGIAFNELTPKLFMKFTRVERHVENGIEAHIELRAGACPYCGRE